MTFAEKYSQLQAYARVDGAILGLLWIASFACFVGQFHYPFCGMLWMASLIGTPIWVGFRTARFRDRVLEGVISFRRAYGFSIFTMFYASLILAIGQFVYFQFLDHGFVISQYMQLLSDPGVKDLLKGYGMTEDVMKEAVSAFQEMRPIDLSLELLYSNITIIVILCLPIALICKRSLPRNPYN